MDETGATSAPSLNGRDGKGRFAKGNGGGPGNPLVSRTEKLRSALVDAATPADITAIAKRLIADAKAGDVTATKELFDRLFGKAKESLEVSGKDGGPVKSENDAGFNQQRYDALFALALGLGRIAGAVPGPDPADRGAKPVHPNSPN